MGQSCQQDSPKFTTEATSIVNEAHPLGTEMQWQSLALGTTNQSAPGLQAVDKSTAALSGDGATPPPRNSHQHAEGAASLSEEQNTRITIAEIKQIQAERKSSEEK